MKRYKIVLAIVVILLLAGMAAGMFRLRGGVTVKPAEEQSKGKEVILYRQDDSQWEKDTLGDSRYTMESSGCLVTCIASALSMGGENVTPGELNGLFSENGVYDEEGNLLWDKLRELEEYEADVCPEVSAALIDTYLEQGRYPIARVRMNGVENFHYVLIAGSEGDSYLCMDPLQDEIMPLSYYLNRVYALRCVYRTEKSKEDPQEAESPMEEAENMEEGIRTWISGQAELPEAEYQNLTGYEWSQRVVFGNEGHAATYGSRQALLEDCGFAGAEPFYRYFDRDGTLLLELYLDEKAKTGCGFRYFAGSFEEEQLQETQAFTIDGMMEDTWEEPDVFSVMAYDGSDGKDAVEDYEEHYEYTEDGRLASYRSWGTVDWLGDPGEETVMDILNIKYEYRDDNTLSHRSYAHNPHIFGTTCCTMESDYDEAQRPVYETCYITHGTYENYYIYKDDKNKPAYFLGVDNNLGDSIPVLVQYK